MKPLFVAALLLLTMHAFAKSPKAVAKVFFKMTAAGGLIVTLDGSTSYDVDGSIANYEWRQIGMTPNVAVIASPNSAATTIAPDFWILGIYWFELKVTDNQGGFGKDSVSVTVVNTPNLPPVVNAGNDVSITQPASTVKLNGSASDPDGTMKSITWSFVNGPTVVSIQGQGTLSPTIGNLTTVGDYIVRLSGTDSAGTTKTDDVKITVKKKPCTLWDWFLGRCK